jgi:hypothetical protein
MQRYFTIQDAEDTEKRGKGNTKRTKKFWIVFSGSLCDFAVASLSGFSMTRLRVTG